MHSDMTSKEEVELSQVNWLEKWINWGFKSDWYHPERKKEKKMRLLMWFDPPYLGVVAQSELDGL